MTGLQFIPTGTSFPGGVAGALFFRTDLSKLYGFDGSDWRQMGLLDSNSNLIIPGRQLKA